MRSRDPWPVLVSPAFDGGWFVMPGIVAAIVGLAIGLGVDDPAGREDAGVGLFLVGIVLVDVAHVWASLYRTVLDPVARRHHRRRLVGVPLLCGWFAMLLHLEEPRLMWRVLAYLAIVHFIKQHVGFALLYVRKGGETPWDRRIVSAAIWAGTAGPVVWWHARLPTRIVWFVQGDLVAGLPLWIGWVALAVEIPVWIAFVGRRVVLARQGRWNPMVVLLVLIPAINWHLGMVVFDDDRVFTITHVFAHGIPYLALTWVAGGRERVASWLPMARRGAVSLVGVYYGLVVALAFGEELVWDRLVWHDHPMVFGGGEGSFELAGLAEAVVVALLVVPQATHYCLDAWIWRVGPENPELARQLGLRAS